MAYSEKSMHRNVVYNYLAQFTLAVSGLLTLPFLLKVMGAELYAFVAIFFTIQTLLSIVDGGLSGSLSREFALNRYESTRCYCPGRLFKKAEYLFIALGIGSFIFIYLISGHISNSWLILSIIDSNEAEIYIRLIGCTVAFRLVCGLYRAVLIGYEKQKKLSLVNIGITFARYIIILPILLVTENIGLVYFSYQLVITALEVILLRIFAFSNVKELLNLDNTNRLAFDYFKSIFRNSFEIWVLTIIWVTANQIDKIILTKTISLEDFGYFSIVSSLSAGIILLGGSVTNAVMPNLAKLMKNNDYDKCKQAYFFASRFLCLVSLPIVLTIAAVPNHILYLFVNDIKIANNYSEILRNYSLGSFFLLMSGLTFLLKQSQGKLRQNIKLNIYYLIIIFFLMVTLIGYFNLAGASYAWIIANLLLTLLIIRPLNVLNKINFHNEWLYLFLIKPIFLSLPVLMVIFFANPELSNKFNSFGLILLILVSIFLSIMAPFILERHN